MMHDGELDWLFGNCPPLASILNHYVEHVIQDFDFGSASHNPCNKKDPERMRGLDRNENRGRRERRKRKRGK